MENPNDLFVNKRLREMIFGEEDKEDSIETEEPLKEMSIPPENIEKPYYVDEQIGYTSLQYLLKPDIPRKYYAEFRKFLLLIDKLTPISYITREDILRYKILFRMISSWYRLGLPEVARRYQAEFLFEMQLSRAVDGFERIMQATTRQVTVGEGSEEPHQKPSRVGLLRRLFGGGR